MTLQIQILKLITIYFYGCAWLVRMSLVVLARESLHVCTVGVWCCEHARFCVEVFIHNIFIQSFIYLFSSIHVYPPYLWLYCSKITEKKWNIFIVTPPLPPSKTTTLSTSFYHPYLEQMQVGQQSLGLHVTVPVQYQYDFQQLTLGIKKHTNKTNP